MNHMKNMRAGILRLRNWLSALIRRCALPFLGARAWSVGFFRRSHPVVGAVLAVAVLFAVGLILTSWYLNPQNADERKDALVTNAQILGGLLVFGSLVVAWRTLDTNRQGQITDRFTRAIDQLGSVHQSGEKQLEIRLGGIYALERIARDSPRDHPVVMEVLTAYVRENAPWHTDPADDDVVTDQPGKRNLGYIGKRPPTDIQAVLTVLKRRNLGYEEGTNFRLDLGRADLSGCDLNGAHLDEANFMFSRLGGAILVDAHLREANLARTILSRALLMGADLQKAFLAQTIMEDAILMDANLQGAQIGMGTNLSEANLERANLHGADVGVVKLRNANLSGANLAECYMELAMLRGAKCKGASFRGSYLKDANLCEADFEGADLRAACFEGANMRGCNLRGADLRGAWLAGASGLTVEQLSSAIVDDSSVFWSQAPSEAADEQEADEHNE